MSYYNCGANGPDGRPATKKALRELLASSPEEVFFDGTSWVATEGQPRGYRGNELQQGVSLSVVGPDPYDNRKWYATVKLSSTGEIQFS